MIIRELKSSESRAALELIWSVFNEFDAPLYSKEGVETFYKSIRDTNFLGRLNFLGAFDDKNNIIGIIATRNNSSHISLFFVDSKFHKRGIGKKLFYEACKNNKSGKITVHSSPYAVGFYHNLGFKDLDTEKVHNGIIYTPMICNLK